MGTAASSDLHGHAAWAWIVTGGNWCVHECPCVAQLGVHVG
jgi:hypothetical protein